MRGIITPQCVDKMLSNNTFLETRIQKLLNGLIFVEKGFGVHVQRMLKLRRCIYTGGNFKQNVWKKSKENWEYVRVQRSGIDTIKYHTTLFTIMILQNNDLVPFLLKYIMRSLLARLTALHPENVN